MHFTLPVWGQNKQFPLTVVSVHAAAAIRIAGE